MNLASTADAMNAARPLIFSKRLLSFMPLPYNSVIILKHFLCPICIILSLLKWKSCNENGRFHPPPLKSTKPTPHDNSFLTAVSTKSAQWWKRRWWRKRPFLPPSLQSTKATPNKNNHPQFYVKISHIIVIPAKAGIHLVTLKGGFHTNRSNRNSLSQSN
jgi:hypothetical protein